MHGKELLVGDQVSDNGSDGALSTEDVNAAATREELWQQRRHLKTRLSRPNRQNRLEKTFLWLEQKNLENLIRYRDFYLKFGNISTDSGFAPGVRHWNPRLGGSSLAVQSSAAYSVRGYQLYDLQFGKGQGGASEFFVRSAASPLASKFGDFPEQDRRFFLYADLRYRRFPQEDFFGVGPVSRKSDRTDFVLEDASYDVVGGYQVNRWLGVGAKAGFLQVNVDRGTDERFPATQELFTEASAPGLIRQPNFFRMSSAIFIDYRDQPGNPHRGGLFGFTFSRYDDRGGSDFEFNRFAFDVRQYVALGSVQRVLALRFFTSLDDAGAARRVPFYLQQTLGGSDTLRGFREFRFRDANLLHLSAEYRWEASPALEFVLFYDAGKVFSSRSDFDFERLEKSAGIGVRFKTPRAVLFRIDAGWSIEGTRIYFKFGPSF